MITEKVTEYAKQSALMKQEATLSPLMCFSICAHCLFGPKWYDIYEHDYDFFVGAYSGTTGVIAFNWDKYRETTDIEYRKMIAEKSSRIIILDQFDKDLAVVEKLYLTYHPDKIKSLNNDELKKVIFRGIESGGLLLRDTLFCESLDEEMAKQYYLELGGQEKDFIEYFEKASLLVFDSFKSRRDKIILEQLKNDNLDYYNLQWLSADYYAAKLPEEIKKEISQLALDQLKSEIAENDVVIKSNKQRRDNYVEKLSPELKILAEFINQIMYIRDWRKDGFAKSLTVAYNAAYEYFKRLSLEPTDCIYALYTDFTDHLVDQQDYKDIIKKRKKGAAVLALPGQPVNYSWEFGEYNELRDKILDAVNASNGDDLSTDELKGQIACKGQVIGTAKVILSLDEFSKFEQDDILITSMTRPEFMPLIKKASAIVTDEGGITCHAAIISRELNIPCIIGTKNATKYFKDNDQVEVDADNGFVKHAKENTLDQLKQYQASDWYAEHGPGRPLNLSGIIRGFTSGLRLQDYEILLCYYKDGEVDWLTLVKNQNEIYEQIFAKHRADNKYWFKEFGQYMIVKNKLASTFERLKNKDLSQLSNLELIRDIETYINLQWQTRQFDSLIDAYLLVADQKLSDLLDKYAKHFDQGEFNPKKVLEILTKPEDPLFLNEVELDLIEIAREIKQDQNLKEKFIKQIISFGEIKNSLIGFKINNHLDRFSWFKVESFYAKKDYTFTDVVAHLSELLTDDLDKVEKNNKLWQINNQPKEKLLSKYRFNNAILEIVELAPLFAKWQDLRKENTVMATYLNSLYLQELSKRIDIDEHDLAHLDYQEITKCLEGKIDKKKLAKRKDGILFVFQKDQFEIFSKDEAETIINKFTQTDTKAITEFSGITACTGKATGKVKIIVKLEDNKKVNKGDILVANMTRPEQMPAMKKAAAIITNEGGITCHAAIVSRELGIPCIIGTKIATKVLHDGDEVEVDADTGMIKILK